MRILPIQNKILNPKSKSFKEQAQPTVQSHEKSNNNISKVVKYGIPIGLLLMGGIGIKLYQSKKVVSAVIADSPEINDYIKSLAKSLSKWLNKDIDPKNLQSIISGEELLVELKALKKENFIASAENIKAGIFCADLHSHSLYSDGLADVEIILNQVSKYADELYAKNNKKFLYSLTDHDSCEGVKKALKIIAENPEKFKNVKFVTGSELSFLIESNKTTNPFETSEILVYGFNPFDEKIQNYFQNLYSKRKKMVVEFIKDLNSMFGYANFSIEEFNKTYGANYMMNYQWKVQNYGQTKNAVAGYANSLGKDINQMYQDTMSKTERWGKMLHHLKEKGLVPADYGEDTRIIDLCRKKYSPHWNNNEINYLAETNFEEIINTFGNSNDVFGAFAHPYYITERNSQAKKFINELIKKGNGFIKATESYHQAYNKNVDINKVEELNRFIVRENKILELGGRDNHEMNWLN